MNVGRLLLVHGHLCFARTSKLIQYSLHKNLVFVLPQFFFLFYSASSAQLMYDGQLASLFNVFFSALPIVSVALFDTECYQILLFHLPKL